jgi:hypothetical protein
MASLYADEDFPLQVVVRLRELGHDVLTAHDAGQANRALPDEQVLDFAVAQYRAVLTLNRRHFVRLHLAGAGHGGIVVCTFDLRFREQAERIHAAIAALPTLRGQLLRVNREP